MKTRKRNVPRSRKRYKRLHTTQLVKTDTSRMAVQETTIFLIQTVRQSLESFSGANLIVEAGLFK